MWTTWRAVSLATVALLGCGNGSTPDPEAPRSGAPQAEAPRLARAEAPEAPSAQPPAPVAEDALTRARGACAGAAMRTCYGALQIRAGKGDVRRKGRNGWKSSFEGGPALDAELSRPHFAMADRSGAIYIADKDAHAIRRLAPDGTIATVAGTGKPGDDGDAPAPGVNRRLSRPNGLWVRDDGTVYILDLGNSKVRKLDPSGQLTTLFSVREGIAIGRGLWVDDNETRAYVASNRRVLQWTRDRGVRVFASGFGSLGNLVVDPSGAVVVTDRVAGRVYRIAASGKKTAIAGTGRRSGGGDGQRALDTALPGVRAIWFHPHGGYLVGTHQSSRVWYIDPDGMIHALYDDRAVSEVRGLSLDRAGNLIIVDDDHGFVRMAEFRPPDAPKR